MKKCYYDLLDVKINATTDEIKSSFRNLAKKYHPDTSGVGAESREIYDQIRSAYEILSDQSLRKSYDKQTRFEQTQIKRETYQRKIADIDDATRLEIILAWSTTKKTFNSSFTASCLNNMAEGRPLSHRQRECIENIMISWEIDVEYWLDSKYREEALNEYFNRNSEETSNPFRAFDPEE